MVLVAGTARAGWDQNTLEGRVSVVAPSGAKLEFFQAGQASIFAIAADYKGEPLPAMKSIVVRLSPPESGRVHASYFQGTKFLGPYQTAPVWVEALSKIPQFTEFALWQEKDGEWGTMIPLVGGGLRTYLSGDGKNVITVADSLDSHFAPKLAPLFAIGWGKDPYQLTHDLYAFGFKTMKNIDPHGVIGAMREDKKFPEIWGYVGWCSWVAYWRYVDQKDLVRNAQDFKKAGFPVRFFLIDDCWETVNKQTMDPLYNGRLFLTGLDADAKKFPGGMKATTEILKKEYGIQYVGVWHTFNGYWNGISLDSPIGRDLKDSIMPVNSKVGIPDPRSDAGEKFWDAWYKLLKDSGIDFVKVDNQGTLPLMTKDILPVTQVTGQSHKNIEAAQAKYFDLNVMNCMNENVDTIYEWEKTNLGRSSVDFNPSTYTNPRSNAVLNIFNSLWFTQISWPDYDMWMSHGRHAEYYAVGHAISSGPVYTTDKPGKEKFNKLWPLIFADGKVIRTDEPALPLKKYLLKDPYLDQVPLAAFAPVRGSGMLAAWNVDKYLRPVKAELSPADIEGIKGDKFAVYEQFSGKLQLADRSGTFPVQLAAWDVKLYSVVPVKDGFAPIGLVNKYVSPATIVDLKQEQGRAVVKLAEAGTFAAYCAQAPKQIKLNGALMSAQTYSYKESLLKVNIAALTDGHPPMTLENNFLKPGGKMRIFILIAIAVLGLALISTTTNAGWDKSTLTGKIRVTAPTSGVQGVDIVPSADGNFFAVVVNYKGPALPARKSIVLELDPPPAQHAFISHVKFRDRHFDPYWTEPQWTTSLGNFSQRSIFVLWQEAPDKWGAMVSLVGNGMQTYLEGTDEKIIATAESRADNFAPARTPMFAIGFGSDPYKLVDDIYAFGLKTMKDIDPEAVVGNLRKNKKFPELWSYVGWCSWNAYYENITEDELIASAKSFKESNFPVRFFLIDDRWMAVTKTKPVAGNGRFLSLTDFEADPKKFPSGLAHAVQILKKDYGISYVGMWHTFQGYWNGVALNSQLGRDQKDALMQVSSQVGVPDPRSSAGEKFWDNWYKFLSGAGVDFVKVDNQSDTPSYFHGLLPATAIMSGAQKNLEAAAKKYFNLNLLNCMSLNINAIYQWNETNVARASINTWPKQKLDPRHHAVDTVGNALWLSNLDYPDYDMWFTTMDHADYHAIGRAISGGPVYITDHPESHKLDLVWPLIYSDGTVIRLTEPGLPARQSLLNDPYTSGAPWVAFGRAGDAGILAAWNVSAKIKPVSGELSPSDVEGIQGDSFVVYDYFAGTASKMGRDQKFAIKLNAWGVKLFSVAPIKDGFAAIGLVNKYASPATIIEDPAGQGPRRGRAPRIRNFRGLVRRQAQIDQG